VTTCSWVDPVEGECTSVGIHMRKYHNGFGIVRQMLCERHWEVVVDEEYSKVYLDFQHVVDKLLATPALPRAAWEQRYKAFETEMHNFQDALARMTK
jgi:hypothetical protein